MSSIIAPLTCDSSCTRVTDLVAVQLEPRQRAVDAEGVGHGDCARIPDLGVVQLERSHAGIDAERLAHRLSALVTKAPVAVQAQIRELQAVDLQGLSDGDGTLTSDVVAAEQTAEDEGGQGAVGHHHMGHHVGVVVVQAFPSPIQLSRLHRLFEGAAHLVQQLARRRIGRLRATTRTAHAPRLCSTQPRDGC